MGSPLWRGPFPPTRWPPPGAGRYWRSGLRLCAVPGIWPAGCPGYGGLIFLMDILVLSLVAGLVVAGGVWMATRDTKSERDRES